MVYSWAVVRRGVSYEMGVVRVRRVGQGSYQFDRGNVKAEGTILAQQPMLAKSEKLSILVLTLL